MIEFSLIWMVLPSFWALGVDKVTAEAPNTDVIATCITFRFVFFGIDITFYRPA